MFKGIRHRLTAYYLMVIAIVVFVMGAFFVWFLQYSYMQNLKESLYNQSLLTSSLIEELVRDGIDEDLLDQHIAELGDKLKLRITLIDSNGRVVADSDENPLAMDDHGSRPEIVDALNDGRGSAVRESTTLGEEMLYFAVPLRIDRAEEHDLGDMVVRLALPLTDVKGSVNSILLFLSGALILAGLLALIVSIILAKKFTVPIEQISSAAGDFAAGNFYPDLNVPGGDELSMLAGHLKAMGESIDLKIDQVVLEKNKLETVVSTLSSGVIFTDQGLIVELINPAAEKIFETSQSRVLGEPIRKVVRNYVFLENLKAVLSDGKSRIMEMNLYGTQGTVLETHILPVSGSGSSINGILIVFNDVTGLRSLEKMRSDFVSNASHELRTPLTKIRGYAETILHERITAEQEHKFLQIIEGEAIRLSDLLDDLLDLARIENEKSFISKDKVDLVEIINGVRSRVEELRQERDFRISTPSTLTAFKVNGNSAWLTLALVNIVENSIRHGYHGGSVEISIASGKGHAFVSIIDNGPGIPEPDLPFIFERFYRVDKARSRDSGGTGLGLAIVKHIMEAHGADYQLESGDSGGIKFTFSLPLAD